MHYTRVVILTFSIGFGFIAHAQQASKTRLHVNVAAGKEMFREYCSVCHGLTRRAMVPCTIAAQRTGRYGCHRRI